jgi:ubiquinone/menaquinone biosynthesis C-methylase UbiE
VFHSIKLNWLRLSRRLGLEKNACCEKPRSTPKLVRSQGSDYSTDCKEKREIRLRYDAEADAYDELYSDEQRMKYELALRRMAFSCEDRIIDCGCGTGIFLEKVAANLRIAVGVDLSPKMLHKADLRLHLISNVHLLCADFDFLPFPAATFTYAFIFTALQAPTRWADSIREALRVLESDGTITLSVPKKEISSEQLIQKLGVNGLESREVVHDETTQDYLTISKRGG